MNFRVIALALSFVWITSAEEAWPQFRGANGGVAKDASPPTEIASEKAKWTMETPEGSSSPCVWGNSIFLTGVNREASEVETLCLDRASGKVRWRRPIKVEKLEATHKASNPAAPTAATDGKVVVAYFGSLGLVAYDFEGKEIWRAALPMARTRQNYGAGASPIIVRERVLIPIEMGNDSYVGAFNLSDGKEVWRAARPLYNSTWATPVHWREKDEDRVGVVNAGRFVAYDWKDGKEVWWIDGVANQACASPNESGGVLYLAAAGVFGDRGAVTIPDEFEKLRTQYDKNGDGLVQFTELPEDFLFVKRGTSDGAGDMSVARMLGFFGKGKSDSFNAEQWEGIRKQLVAFSQSDMNKTSLMAVRTGGTGDATAENVLWNESRGVPEVPSPLVVNGRVYCVKNGGVLTCRDGQSGKLIFEERVAAGGYYASPVAGGEYIYVASDTGAVTVVRAGDKFEVVAKGSLGERIQATPAIVGSNIYIRGQKHLWAFGK